MRFLLPFGVSNLAQRPTPGLPPPAVQHLQAFSASWRFAPRSTSQSVSSVSAPGLCCLQRFSPRDSRSHLSVRSSPHALLRRLHFSLGDAIHRILANALSLISSRRFQPPRSALRRFHTSALYPALSTTSAPQPCDCFALEETLPLLELQGFE